MRTLVTRTLLRARPICALGATRPGAWLARRNVVPPGGKRRWISGLVAAAPFATVLVVATAAPASAHERRTVGAYQLVVGWGDEPAYSTFKNSVQLTLSEANGGPPVTDLGDSLKVELIKGSEKMTVPLEANFRVGAFGTPGDYRAWVTPTRPGQYTFHFTGSIRGQPVDESFTSSRTTFNDVEDVTTIEFPAKDPSTGQLAARLDRELPRLANRTEGVDDRAAAARRLAVAGLASGVAGVIVALVALVVARRGRAGRTGGRSGRAPRGTPVQEAGTRTG